MIAVAIIRLKDLFAAVMLMGIFSLLSASLFTVMDAVDVAFTEAAVGAGISTMLMLATLSSPNSEEHPEHNRFQVLPLHRRGADRRAPWSTAPSTCPATAIRTRPSTSTWRRTTSKHTEEEIGVPNMVTAILASYRGYDTWGETTVIFTACVGVMLLLGGHAHRRAASGGGRAPGPEGGS